ncbi:ATP-binding protein [Haloarcula sp. GH36]|uniref:ATP-binding protein n=1 Tax=Haloarcula montana TaxID=3111776 RepID=UPI002D79D846|nr:hypothetical protein [Haloarcula sp. GH36]
MGDAATPTAPDLPVTAEDSDTYLRIQPALDPLDPSVVETQFRRLHRLDIQSETSWFSSLFEMTAAPTIEWLLVGTDQRLTYYVRTDRPDTIDPLERLLRGLFPDSYRFERVQLRREILLEPIRTASAQGETQPPVGVEYVRRCPANRKDWQTMLTPFEAHYDAETARIPLAGIVETIATSTAPIVVQVLVRARPDWSLQREERRLALETGTDTLGGKIANTLFGPPDDEGGLELPRPDERRLAELDEREPRYSFDMNARALVGAVPANVDHQTPTTLAQDLTTAFTQVSQTTYEITGVLRTGSARDRLEVAVRDASFRDETGLTSRLGIAGRNHPCLVADAREVGNFCLLDGAALTASGRRLVDSTPVERQPLSLPPATTLRRYHSPGLPIGQPLTGDSKPTPRPVSLPPSLQSLHVAWFGKTGSGKSTALESALLENHVATDGADILIDGKGDGMPLEYLRIHYERFGTLENVLYFDCTELLPAFSFFDIRDELDRGIDRTAAVEDRVDHYVEILSQLMGRERFEQAVRSPDIIRYMVKAMFDPVSGADAFSHRDLHGAIQEMHDRSSAPPVSDGDLERMLAGVVANRARTFDEIMQGVANRVEKIPVDPRLARIFNHVPEMTTDGEPTDEPQFDLVDYLNEDVVVIFDMGGLRSESQRALTLLVLSNLWSALKRRAQTNAEMSPDTSAEVPQAEPSEEESLPLVNLYIEEAASVADSSLLSELLSQARSFGCGVTLAMQFPAQLRERSQRAYLEVLNNVSTIVSGNVAVDERLAKRLSTDEMDPAAVATRLRALRRGEWLVSLPAAFDTDEPHPFLVRSLTPPRGHPAAPRTPRRPGFGTAVQQGQRRLKTTAALGLIEPSSVDEEAQAEETPDRVDSALPYTNRLPPTVSYDDDIHGLACRECESRYDPDSSGMRRAIECCSDLDTVDRDDIPICEVNLKLTAEERADAEFADRQLMFLQAVYNAQQLRYDDIEYDIVHDSMLRLQEYLDVESEAIQDLLDAGLLSHDTDRPHRLYTVTPEGRGTIGEHYRKGIDYGHGKGDLEETSQHVVAVEVGRRYLETTYVDDPESPVVTVVPYFELDERDTTAVPAASAMGTDAGELKDAASEYDRHRIDAVGLDEDGRIVVTLEAERVNHDLRRAVPEDFDKMAACDPDEAIWVTMSHSEAHRVLGALNDPLDGAPRIEKTYAQSTPASEFRLDTPGCTAMYTLEQVRDMVDRA